ncbi:hypothetical protein D3C81_2001720 [compost metagenome]
MLQVFNGLDAFGQLGLERRQRLLGQGCPRLGGISLPGQCISNVQFGCGQQLACLVGPFGRNGLLALGTAQLFNALADGLGGTLVAGRQFLEDLLQLLGARVGGQPFAHFGRALARCGS